MRVAITQEKCTSCADCVLTAPEVFDLDDDALVVLLQESPPPELEEAVRRAAAACPSDVIAVAEDD